VPLDPRSVVDFLLERGALEPEDVLDGPLTVTEVHRRNACFAVSRGDARGLFVKQPRTEDPMSLATLHAEAVMAGAAADDERFAPVAAVSPALRLYDPARRVLAVDLLGDSEDLGALSRREGGVPPAIARALGAAVGALHRDVPPGAREAGPGERQAWILSLGDLSDEHLPPGRPALRELRDAAREDPSLSVALEALRDGWRPDALLHGDLKWENVMVAGEGDAVRVHLVDWEMSGFGDPAWDVGGLMHAYLRDWVSGQAPEALAGGTPDTAALAAAAPSVAALWEAYRDVAAPAPGFLERAVRSAGARLLQTAFEATHGTVTMTGHGVGLAQLAANVMGRPHDAASVLFGLSTDAV
jgi:hypothetical protein